jgi:hypothetical protein
MVKIGTKCEVVNENYIGRINLLAMALVQKVSFDQLIFSIALSPPSHKSFKVEIHILLGTNKKKVDPVFMASNVVKLDCYLGVAIGPLRPLNTPGHFTRGGSSHL